MIGRGGKTRTHNRRFWRPLFYHQNYAPVELPQYYQQIAPLCKGAYQNKFNKAFNEGELTLKFGSTNLDLNDEEYKFYNNYVSEKEVLNKYKIDNNINDVIPFKEWKIPDKTKNIVSYIGLALLFGLMIAVFFMDIFRLFQLWKKEKKSLLNF